MERPTAEPNDKKTSDPTPGPPDQPEPDVSSDRVPAAGTPPEAGRRGKSAPLEIREIENLEDDAKGG
jgi:hypothetical protein